MKKKLLIFSALILIGICAYLMLKNDAKIEDNIKFKNEYNSVSENNVFVYRDSDEIIKILEKGTGVVFMGFPECPWCQAYAPMLNEVAKEVGIEKIYYCNIKKDRLSNSSNYQKIVELLKGNLLYDDEGNDRIYVPDVTIVKNGIIIGHNNETSVVTTDDGTPSEYWTEEKIKNLKEVLKAYLIQIKDTSCHDVCDR